MKGGPAETENAGKASYRFDAERRHMTVVFADLVGSTALSVSLDLEDFHELIRDYQRCCEDVVGRFGGHIARYIGDGILIYFGYPSAHERDAEMAVRAGLQIVEAVANIRPAGRADIPPLQTRVGITTGVVVVGDIVRQNENETQALGVSVNLAARLQAVAEPNSVVVSESSMALLSTLFECEDLGLTDIKGFAEPKRVWKIVREREFEDPFEARHPESGLTELVGRDEEIEGLFRWWGGVQAGKCQVVLLSGEPGIGKSRLVRELKLGLRDQPHLTVSCYCAAQQRRSALYPVKKHMEHAAGFSQQDTREEKLSKLQNMLKESGNQSDELLPYLADMLALPIEDRATHLSTSPDLRRQKTLEALERSLLALTNKSTPVLVVFEDLHWIDPTSLELVGRLVESIRSRPILMILTFRTEFSEHWTGMAHVAPLALSRLDPVDSSKIVRRVAGESKLSASLCDQVVRQTDGVPLFLEELTKAVLATGPVDGMGDGGAAENTKPRISVPGTLHDLLSARLDGLEPLAKFVAQLGAVIGRQFRYDLLAAYSQIQEEMLRDGLKQLLEAELLFQRGEPPQALYTFKHALVQDAAYGSLLRSKRRELHGRILSTLNEAFPETVENRPELAAHHATEGEGGEKAIRLWQVAANRALARSEYLEATDYLEIGLALLPGVAETELRDRYEMDLQLAMGRALTATKGHADPNVLAAYSRARNLSQGSRDPDRTIRALVGLWNFYMLRAKHDTARELAEQRLALARQSEDRSVLPGAHQNMAVVLFNAGRFGEALEHIQSGIAIEEGISQGQHILGSYDVRFGCMCYASWINWMLGRPDQALIQAEEVVAMAESWRQPFTLAFAMLIAAFVCQFRREPQAVLTHAKSIISLSEEQQFAYRGAQGMILYGWALSARGESDEGIACLRRGVAAWRETGARVLEPYYLGLLADSLGKAGSFGDGLKVAEQAIALAAAREENFFDAELHRIKGELMLAMLRRSQDHDRSSEAGLSAVCDQFERAIAVARQQGARTFALRAATSLARCGLELGRAEEAMSTVREMYEEFDQGFNAFDLAEARDLIDQAEH